MKYNSFHNYILNNFQEGSNILEFGSGVGTKLLTEKFNVTSIEHDLKYVGLDPKSNYIYAPIINGWFDIKRLQHLIKIKYDVIIVDAPPSTIGRIGILYNLPYFNWDAYIVVDDINRTNEAMIFENMITKLKSKSYEVYKGVDKSFGVINNRK